MDQGSSRAGHSPLTPAPCDADAAVPQVETWGTAASASARTGRPRGRPATRARATSARRSATARESLAHGRALLVRRLSAVRPPERVVPRRTSSRRIQVHPPPAKTPWTAATGSGRGSNRTGPWTARPGRSLPSTLSVRSGRRSLPTPGDRAGTQHASAMGSDLSPPGGAGRKRRGRGSDISSPWPAAGLMAAPSAWGEISPPKRRARDHAGRERTEWFRLGFPLESRLESSLRFRFGSRLESPSIRVA
ncbi:hypothetical protein ACVWXU_000868 [Streptomyces sp. TE33382]